MIWWVYTRVKKAEKLDAVYAATLITVKDIDEVYIYCSDSAIWEYIPEGIMYLRRSENLDRDTTTMNEVLMAFAKDVKADICACSRNGTIC